MISRIVPCCLLCLLYAGGAWAADGGDVVVLVNTASLDSVAVGAHYAAMRGVPDKNICRVTCTTSESISRKSFDAKIRGPLRAFLVSNGLAEAGAGGALSLKVRYLVSTFGVPVKVRDDYAGAALKDLPRDPRRTSAAAVDSELSLIAQSAHSLDGSLANPLYRAPDAKAGAVLFTARLDGPTPEIATGLVDAAVGAEKNGLAGIAAIDARGLADGAYKLGDDWILAAGAALRSAGFFTRVDRAAETFHADMPMPDAAFYFGWYSSILCGPMAKKDFRFAPGAVAYHLHSGSAARVRTKRIGWVGPLLAKGAAATMGAVFEPYLDGTADAGEFARLFLAGKTFAESAHRATPRTSWMMTFIGDPLYAPFRADRLKAAMAKERNRFWRDIHEAILATATNDFDRALAICNEHDSDPLFVELAARAHTKAGRPAAAAEYWLKLATIAKDDHSSARAYGRRGDLFARSNAPELAMKAAIEGAAAHPRSPHSLPLYRKALRLARTLEEPRQEADLWTALADNFPRTELGRFAAGELWARGLRTDCPAPTLTVKRSAAAPVIDGRPVDPVWKQAAGIDALPHRVGPQRAVPRTRIRIICDDAALYLLAEMRNGSGAGQGAGPAAHDESFELMLSPWRDADRAVRIAIPRRGRPAVLPKGVVRRTGALMTKSGGRLHVDGWLVEMKIPFAALGLKPPSAGAMWAANFVERNSVPQFPFQIVPSFRSWAKCGDNPLAADCGGYLIFK